MARARISEPRKIYISYEPSESLETPDPSIHWVQGLYKKLSHIENTTVIWPPEDLLAGDIIEHKLRDLRIGVTDVVVVLTSDYIKKQKARFNAKQEPELSIFINLKQDDSCDNFRIWLAPKNKHLEGCKLGDKKLDQYPWWHWLKEEESENAKKILLHHNYTECCWCKCKSTSKTANAKNRISHFLSIAKYWRFGRLLKLL